MRGSLSESIFAETMDQNGKIVPAQPFIAVCLWRGALIRVKTELEVAASWDSHKDAMTYMRCLAHN